MKEKTLYKWLLKMKPVAAKFFWSLASDPQFVQFLVERGREALKSDAPVPDETVGEPARLAQEEERIACPMCGGTGMVGGQLTLLEDPP